MIVRKMNQNDLLEINNIHEKFYKNEFELPDFTRFLGAFTVIDNDKIITAGGVRPIIESLLITNKGVSVRKRVVALEMILQTLKFTCQKYEMDQIHAFVQDINWERCLIVKGFKPCKGNAVYLNI